MTVQLLRCSRLLVSLTVDWYQSAPAYHLFTAPSLDPSLGRDPWYRLDTLGGMRNFALGSFYTDIFFRYYGAIIPSALNVFTMQGYLILNCIIAGQTLASVSSHLNATLGIVIVSLISMLVSRYLPVFRVHHRTVS